MAAEELLERMHEHCEEGRQYIVTISNAFFVGWLNCIGRISVVWSLKHNITLNLKHFDRLFDYYD